MQIHSGLNINTLMFPRSFHLVCVRAGSRSVEILSGSFILVQILVQNEFTQTHSDPDLFRLVQCCSDFFRLAQICADSLRFTPDSDLLRFTHPLQDSRRPTQVGEIQMSLTMTLMSIPSDPLSLNLIHTEMIIP